MAKKKKISLLEPEAVGGDIAESGFDFQAACVLSKIPLWLADHSFQGMIQEAMGDYEASFFDPYNGMTKELFEAKNHSVTPKEFWGEIVRFRKLSTESPNTYRRFTLACAGIAPQINPIVSAMQRLRGPRGFYNPGEPVIVNSETEFNEMVAKLNKETGTADFLMRCVAIEKDLAPVTANALGMFTQAVGAQLPQLANVPAANITAAHTKLSALLRSNRNKFIPRRALEDSMRGACGVSTILWDEAAIHMWTGEANIPSGSIPLDLRDFSGVKDRSYPRPEEWSARVVTPLVKTAKFIKEHRSKCRIALTGSKRLSTSIAIGHAFSAVKGFAMSVEQRGEWFRTDDYSATKEEYAWTESVEAGKERTLVVVVGLPRNIFDDVKSALAGFGLAESPKLMLHGAQPIINVGQLQSAADGAKERIRNHLTMTGAGEVHLFIATPAHFACFLGHRMNAVARTVCYEWIGPSKYTQTCVLMP